MIYDHELYQEDLELLAQVDIEWERIKGKSILITGASGMVGTFLTDVLMKRNEKYGAEIEIHLLSRNLEKLKSKFNHYKSTSYLKFIEQDVSREFHLEQEHYDYIIHAASNTHPKEYYNDPIGTITTNVFGAYYLLEYAKKHKDCRVVLLSSVEVYGENRGDVTYFNESYCGYLNCNTLRAGYPESKRVSEALLQAYITRYQVDGSIIRLSRIYGPTMETDDSKAISQFIHKAVLGEDIVLKSVGNQLYSYTYIADAVQAILWCMLSGGCGEAYNVADSASDITLKNLAEYLAGITGKNVVFDVPESEEQQGYSTATKALMDSEKIKGLGWKPIYSIREGLERTLQILKGEKYEGAYIKI